ncbi:hypothetical protein [Piscirickettsia salmonis]|nr:hypothetical protein [Piscirickettsia salmonis]ALT18112.1 hypothetical protein PSLF89_03930 [Piscirickettsia salmonis LF-89 = ATCC VR-1361]ALY01768.1 hypothetical protein AWE47_01875 [Piscirickettsia salmonis]AMA41279.1 hypothetical protein AWJ11_01860 [Piscirickettsia salmonis]AOS36475.1 hypothetical protein AVM72_14850 [Piscirickettsia salmonis]APS61158.1 hypothetical protein AVI53_11805 [Piscirickettsia salmonis]
MTEGENHPSKLSRIITMRRKVFVFDLTSITSKDMSDKYPQKMIQIIKNILKNGDKVVFTAVNKDRLAEYSSRL